MRAFRALDRRIVFWQLRRAMPQDIPQLAAIEAECFEFPWETADFLHMMFSEDVAVIEACEGETHRAIGYAVVEQQPSRLVLLNVAVAPSERRQGVGKALVDEALHRGRSMCRKGASVLVRERNVGAQLFFRQLGFRATNILHGCYEESPEDAYLMRLSPTDFQSRLAARNGDGRVAAAC